VNKEYTGPKAGNENDEMVVEVKQTKFNRDNPKFADQADAILRVSTFECSIAFVGDYAIFRHSHPSFLLLLDDLLGRLQSLQLLNRFNVIIF
jgi:hypothetical protein